MSLKCLHKTHVVATFISDKVWLQTRNQAAHVDWFYHPQWHVSSDYYRVLDLKKTWAFHQKVDPLLTGWWHTYPSEKYESQLG